MRLCYVGNPQAIHLQRWMKYFIDKGHEVHVITPEPAEIEGAYIHEISLAAFYDIPTSFFYKIRIIGYVLNLFRRYRLIKQTKKLIKKIKPDVLDAHYLTYYGVLASHLDFHPFIITVWGSDILIDIKKYGRGRADLMKKALEKADMIITDGDNGEEEIIKLVGDGQKIRKISFGVDTKKFNPEQIIKQIRENLGIKTSNSPIVISIRNLEQIYDVETLIRTIPFVVSKFPDTNFIIAGEGSQRDYLKELAESLGVAQSIRFVGSIPHDNLPVYLASSDIYVSTSLSDCGISISTLEAMACGLVPVVTDVADNKKWIKDGENGFVVPVKDPKSVADKIIYLLENKEIKTKFAKINRKIVEEKQNYEKEMEKMEKLYRMSITCTCSGDI
jgi:glycosyltransferase involved in cell wall biosynthesis